MCIYLRIPPKRNHACNILFEDDVITDIPVRNADISNNDNQLSYIPDSESEEKISEKLYFGDIPLLLYIPVTYRKHNYRKNTYAMQEYVYIDTVFAGMARAGPVTLS